MTGPHAGRPRPVNDISNREQWWAIGAAFLPGALVLGTALAAGQPLSLPLIGAVMLAILTPIAGAETARRRTVRRAEDVVTPEADPQTSAGEKLRTTDADVLERALDEVLALRAQIAGDHPTDTPAPPTPAPVPPTGTARYDAIPPSGGRPDVDVDWTGLGALRYDEAAAVRGRDPVVRDGRALADHRDRRDASRPRQPATSHLPAPPRHASRRG